MAKKLIKEYYFTPGTGAGNSYVDIPGLYDLERLLLITNVTDNVFLYNFADATFAGTTMSLNRTTHTDMPKILAAEDGWTRINLVKDNSSMSSSDSLQIYIEDQSNEQGMKVRPYDFGTDAIERARVANPQSLIDADFEYGLQPTKWAGFGTVKGYPSAYDLPAVDLDVTAITTDYQNDNTSNSLITVTYGSAHGQSVGDIVNVSGLNSGVTGFSRADGNFVIHTVPTSTKITYYARGIVGASNGDSLYTEETIVRKGLFYANAALATTGISGNGSDPSTMTVTFDDPHGLIPGTPIHVTLDSGTNHALADGPFVITKTPSKTSFEYTARGGGAITTLNRHALNAYAFSNATILHRPSDGGVILSTKTPTYAASVTRQTKRYFRYQSGKGYLWSSGTLFAPNYDIQSVSAAGTAVGDLITVKTDDIDHGLQKDAVVKLEGITTSGYNNSYSVDSIVDDYTFKVAAKTTLGDTTAVLQDQATVRVTDWVGAAVRAGMFDDTNGVFWEYDGNQLFACIRSSTRNVTGSVAVTKNASVITGTNTRFTEQLRAGDKVVIKGMMHFVSNVDSNTEIHVTPDYRGVTGSGVRIQKVAEKRIPQMKFNLDKLDGTGPSRFNFDPNKMQMLGLELSWYGAGFIHFMMRGPDGKWVYAHREKNNNVNDEAYMRSGNLPVRYSIDNDAPITFLTAGIDSSDSSIPVDNLQEFTDAGTLFIDNEIIKYTGRSATDGPGNFTGCTRAATLSQYLQGTNGSFTAGGAVPHSSNTGIIEISNTCSPTLSHWGSALVMDGGFDQDRGYLFTHARSHNTSSDKIGITPVTSFVIRLAPSISNSSVGRLGAKDLLNRSQMLLETVGIALGRGSSTSGEVVVQGVLNPKNFSDATWSSFNGEDDGGQPSFAQYANTDDITWSTGSYAEPGEVVFAFVANASRSDSLVTEIDLTKLKQMDGAPIGGDFKYPDGPDILAINAFVLKGDVKGTIQLRWTEAQA